MVMDSLRYWVEECHVDGFRFDLAVSLTRDRDSVDFNSPFLDAVTQDPVLAKVKMISESWDLGKWGYQVGNFPPGVDVVRQGEAAEKFYFIRHGVVEVVRTEKVDGKETVKHLADLKEGDFFGETALLTGAPRNATVRTRSRSILYTLAKVDFDAAVQASATFHEELQKSLFARQ